MNARTVVVDGVEIPEALLAQEVQNHPGASIAEARTVAGHALAIRALLINRARELGLAASPETDGAGREETLEEALIRVLLDEEVEIDGPTELECRRFYGDGTRFVTPQLYEASHILVAPLDASDAAVADAGAAAMRLIGEAASGRERFADLAREFSACPSGALGGALGQLRRGDLVPEVEAALDELEPGETASAPVRSRFGWHVLRLERRIEGRTLPFELVEDRIRLHLESRAWTAAAARYVADLAAAARSKGVALTLSIEGQVEDASATLGSLIGDQGAVDRLEVWLDAAEPELAARVRTAAATAGESVRDFAQGAMADFLRDADDERWTNLISAARDAVDPALACLATVLRSKLAPAKRTLTLSRRAAH